MVNHRFESSFAFVLNCVHNVAAATSFGSRVTSVNTTLSYDAVSQYCDYSYSVAAAELACAEFWSGHRFASGSANEKKKARPEVPAFVCDTLLLFRSIVDICNYSTKERTQSQDITRPVGNDSFGIGSNRYLLWNCNVMSAVSMLLRGIGALRPNQSCRHSISGKH